MAKTTTPDDTLLPDATGSEEAYQRFLPEAEQLDPKVVVPLRGDVLLAHTNIETGLAALAPHEAQLAEELPKVKFAKLKVLPELALAVAFANTQHDAVAASQVQDLLARASPVRTLLLGTAEALALAKLLPAKDVQKIREGVGKFDMASDCVALAALFRQNAATIKGKHAVSAKDIAEAADVGTQLLAVLKPKGAKASKVSSASVDKRDRLWTLLVQGFRDLRRAGMNIWVDEVNDHVPPLQAHKVAKKKAKAQPAQPAVKK